VLSDAIVRGTIASQPRFRSGFRVVTDASGRYLSPHSFVIHVLQGDYQNGASWLLFDYIALATGILHHVPGLGLQMHNRLAEEFEHGTTFHEYLNTNPRSVLFNTDAPYRDGFSWNTFVVVVDAVVKRFCTTL
jgi:hypothetical protein